MEGETAGKALFVDFLRGHFPSGFRDSAQESHCALWRTRAHWPIVVWGAIAFACPCKAFAQSMCVAANE